MTFSTLSKQLLLGVNRPFKTQVTGLLQRAGAFILLSLFLHIPFQVSAQSSRPPEIDPALRAKLKDAVAQAKSFEDRFDAQVWLMQKDHILQRFIDDHDERLFILRTVHQAATEAGVPPDFVLAVIEVESRFDRFALSSVGARGLMQVMPFWKNEIGREEDNLMEIETNLRYGCTILKHYLERANGNWAEALARYNGSYGQIWYAERVMVAWQERWR